MEKKERLKIKENNVKKRLQEIGMTQQELADIVGTFRGHINKIINEKSKCVSLPIAIKMAKALGTSVEELFIID